VSEATAPINVIGSMTGFEMLGLNNVFSLLCNKAGATFLSKKGQGRDILNRDDNVLGIAITHLLIKKLQVKICIYTYIYG
jgi:hypothetical protein